MFLHTILFEIQYAWILNMVPENSNQKKAAVKIFLKKIKT